MYLPLVACTKIEILIKHQIVNFITSEYKENCTIYMRFPQTAVHCVIF
jgi:hypothetical protein